MKSGIRIHTAHYLIVSIVLITVFVAGNIFNLYAQPAEELFKKANELYKANQFQAAAENYEKILSQGYRRAEVYYNLGNCYFKLNNTGKAILSYERALKLEPKDEDILHNLKLAESRVSDKIEPVPQLAIIRWWNTFVTFNSSKGWGIFCLVSLWIAVLIFGISLFTPYRRGGGFISTILVLLSLAFLALAIHQRQDETHSSAAIVMVPSSYVKSAPDANANDLFVVHEGVRMEIVDKVGDWNKIRLADGKIGWIESGSFERI